MVLICACGTEVKTAKHFLLLFHFYSTLRLELFENLEKTDPNFVNLNVKDQLNVTLYSYQENKPKRLNQSILKMFFHI